MTGVTDVEAPTATTATGAAATGWVRTGPYRGLVPYEAADVRYFRGREREVAAVFERLFASRLTIVYGESGVGKSSILRAGVATRLEDHSMAVPVLVTKWRGDPVDIIHRSVEGLAETRADESLAEHLARAVENEGKYVMVILDQFEELLRTARYEDDRAAVDRLFDCIVQLADDDQGVSFAIALRADAVAEVDVLLSRVHEGAVQNYRIGSMSEEHARTAIIEPLAIFNEDHGTRIEIESDLVSVVTSGVAARADHSYTTSYARIARSDIDLPFLQIVMSRLWDEEQNATSPASDVIRLETLQRLGGTEAILAEHVNRTLSNLSVADQRTAAHLLSHLVTPSGAKVLFSANDLSSYTGVPEAEVVRILEGLASGDARLLRPGRDALGRSAYELFHDRLSEHVAAWSRREIEREVEWHRMRYRQKVVTWAVVFGIAALLVIGALVWWAWPESDDGPPLAEIQTVTIAGFTEDQTEVLFDGETTEELVIPVDGVDRFKISVEFTERFDIIDVRVEPARADGGALAPKRIFISQTEIDVPVGEVRPKDRGAYGRTGNLVLIVEPQDLDMEVRLTELRFWRRE
jgi:hypothetical protein